MSSKSSGLNTSQLVAAYQAGGGKITVCAPANSSDMAIVSSKEASIASADNFYAPELNLGYGAPCSNLEFQAASYEAYASDATALNNNYTYALSGIKKAYNKAHGKTPAKKAYQKAYQAANKAALKAYNKAYYQAKKAAKAGA